jgi:hypothetical protein
MVRHVSAGRTVTPGYVLSYPNREKASSHAAKAIVVALLLISVVLMLAVTFGGWSAIEGMKPLDLIWCAVYLVMAFYIGVRWARGLLPLAAALAVLLLMFSLIAGTGASGTSWFDRSHYGYSPAYSIFGGRGLSADSIGLLVLLLAPVQVLLILFALLGFSQGWNVETEVPESRARGRRRGGGDTAPAPA